MYSDKDGASTSRSQAAYDARMRPLLLITSTLSCIGLGAAVMEYVNADVEIKIPLCGLQPYPWGHLLWPCVCFNSLGMYHKDSCIKKYNAGVRGSVLSLLIVLSRLLAEARETHGVIDASSLPSLQLYAATLLAFIQLLFPRRPNLFTPEGLAVDLESSASALSRYSMNWCSTALHIAGNSNTLDAFPVIDYDTRSRSQSPIAITSPGAYVWNRILTERFLGFANQWALVFVREVLTFGPPFCVMRLLKCLEDQDRRSNEAWMWLLGIGASSLGRTIVNHHLIWVQWSKMGIPVRAQLIMSVFKKTLKKKDSKEQRRATTKSASHKPDVINLIASDTHSLSKFTAVNYIIPSKFISFAFAVFFLFNLLGWQSTVAAIAMTILCVSIHTLAIKQQRNARKGLQKTRDRTTEVLKEAVSALRQIKFSALEAQWEEHIDSFRQRELQQLSWLLATRTLRGIWDITAPFLVATASIGTYLHLGGAATPSIVFPMLAILPQLESTVGFVPVVLLDYFGSITTAHRIDKYLTTPEQKCILGASPSGAVRFRDAEVRWPSDDIKTRSSDEKQDVLSHRFSLHGLTLDFPVGELSVISGKTGSGKSLMLAAILGEADLLGGHINAPSIAQGRPVAFVSQSPWLQSVSVRENILFGSPFNRQRYEKVLAACALEHDVATLSKGDETQIGSRGVKLSGGQRARLAFARALYSSAQLLVLDDIFSALDSHVSKDIFNALTGELGKGRTRILATHHVSLCAQSTKYLVHLEDGTVVHAGTPDSALKDAKTVESEKWLGSEPWVEDESAASADEKKRRARPSETLARYGHSRGDFTLYKRYFSAAGGVGFTTLYIVGLVVNELLRALTTFLLGRIKSAGRASAADHAGSLSSSTFGMDNELRHSLYMYLGASALAITWEGISNPHQHAGGIRASKALFREMTFRIIRMPLAWLDTTPIGETLKAFTADVWSIDEGLLVSLSDFASSIVKLTTVICVGLYSSKYTGVSTLILLFWGSRISKSYIRGRSTVKRADKGPIADILELFTTTIAGISTIRAFGGVDAVTEEMHSHIDKLSTARRYFWIFNRWLGLQMSFIGIAFTMGTGAVLLSSESIIDTSHVGFSLTFSMGLNIALFNAVNNFAMLESYMDAVAAVTRYTDLEMEDHSGGEVPADWPSAGEVVAKGLEIAYGASLPLVLKSVSFTANSGQRFGIVGRTGAGKSSLTLSLLRLLEPRRGSIQIDGIDISTTKLSDLRSRIAFIAQDPTLFSGTIRSNLDYFNEVSTDKLNEALRRVKLLAEDGDEKSGLFTVDSHISAGGANMSQGQRQLLCLARILIKKPKIIILDEATSAVDNKTDMLMQEIIRTQFCGTLIVVAHRLRTIAAFDQVVVVSEGRIAEAGTPADLLRRKGVFCDLVEDSHDEDFLKKTILGS